MERLFLSYIFTVYLHVWKSNLFAVFHGTLSVAVDTGEFTGTRLPVESATA